MEFDESTYWEDEDDVEESETLDFFLPGDPDATVLQLCEPDLLHRQLVCWCLIQRYRYYVLDSPVAPDELYDKIEKQVKDLEDEYGLINSHSPTKKPGSSRRRLSTVYT